MRLSDLIEYTSNGNYYDYSPEDVQDIVDDLRNELTQESNDDQQLLMLLQDLFHIIRFADGLEDLEYDLLDDSSVESIGSIIRSRISKSPELGRDLDDVYMSIVYLVLTDRGEDEDGCIMLKPKTFYDMMRQ